MYVVKQPKFAILVHEIIKICESAFCVVSRTLCCISFTNCMCCLQRLCVVCKLCKFIFSFVLILAFGKISGAISTKIIYYTLFITRMIKSLF